MKALSERLTDMKPVSRGALATCYRAREIALDRPVFLKVLHPEIGADADLRARFAREARALARLDHPHVVRLYEFGEDPQFGFYMLLEYVEGTTLAARLLEGGKPDPHEVFELAAQVLSGLIALHEASILHRDLKPQNILVRNDGVYKITDFSLAALRDEPKLTHHHAIVGTPAYMSPEQAAGQPPDERSDLFALGVVLHEAVTGANPFTCDDMLEAMRRVRQMDPPLDTEELQALPESVHSLIQSCLRKDPSARPNSAADALKLIADGTNAVEQPRHRERKQTRIVLSLSIVVIMCLAMVISFWPRRDGGLNLSHTTPRGSEIMSDNLSAEQPINDEKLPAEKQTASHDTASTIDPAPVAEHVGEETVARIDRAIRQNTATDSTELWLDVSPWAHVYYNGRRLGTTPMRYSVRLPAGRQTFSFHNPAFPEIHLTMDLAQGHDSIRVNLAEHVAMLEIEVSPWGNVYLDGEPVGSSPLAHPLFFRPGLHNVRVSHPTLRAVEKSFEAQAGDTIMVIANLDRTELAMRRTRETTE